MCMAIGNLALGLWQRVQKKKHVIVQIYPVDLAYQLLPYCFHIMANERYTMANNMAIGEELGRGEQIAGTEGENK